MADSSEYIEELSPKRRVLFELLLKEERKQSLQRLRIPRCPRADSYPLSYAQQRLWFLNQFEPESALYNMPFALRLEGELDVAALERSLQEIVRRHEALRTKFTSVSGEPAQSISENWRIPLPVLDLSALAAEKRMEAAKRIAREEGDQPFDLGRAPMVRYRLLRLDLQDHVLVVNMHHIVSDGWSVGVMRRELSALYRAYSQGESPALDELEAQYIDFAVWQRKWLTGDTLQQQLNYWRKQLAGLQPLNLPMARPRPPMASHRGGVVLFSLPPEVTTRLVEFSRREGLTLFMTFLSAFKALLHRYTGQDDIAVGCPIANRTRAETEKLIGFFVNTLVLRTDVSGNPSFRELIGRVRDVTLAAYTHQDLPFDALVEDLMPKRKTNYTPLVSAFFEIHDVSVNNLLQLPKLSWSSIDLKRQVAYFDFTLLMNETPDGIDGSIEYSTDLFDADTIEEMTQRFESLLEAVSRDFDLRILDIPLSPEESVERDQRGFILENQSHDQDQFLFD